MKRLTKILGWVLLLGLLSVISSIAPVAGQENTVPVPNLAGLSVPRAAAELNRVGLVLGTRQYEAWTAASAVPQSTIRDQSLPAGQAVAPGAAVNVTVLQSPNLTLVYDENDFTVINQTGSDIRLDNLSFHAIEGHAALAASQWAGGLRTNYCVQIWSIQRSTPKDVAGCEGMQNWFSNVNNRVMHFWTALNGVSRFVVAQDGVVRGECEAAAAGAEPRQCQVYISAAQSDELTPYLYFAYTPSRLIILNRSEDRWMMVRDAVILNNNPNLSQPGMGIRLGDPSLYQVINPVANLTQLAPGQCLLFTNGAGLESLNLPQACDVVGQLNIDPNLIFWGSPFTVNSITDGQQRSCDGAIADRLTICVMPR
jgi:hypothetical protein